MHTSKSKSYRERFKNQHDEELMKDSRDVSAKLPWSELSCVNLDAGDVTIWHGATNVGKSTVMNMLALSLSAQGHPVIMRSMENRSSKTRRLLAAMFHNKKIDKNNGELVQRLISEMEGREDFGVLVRPNNGDDNLSHVMEHIIEVAAHDYKHYIVDNLMMMCKPEDYNAQHEIMKHLNQLADDKDIHIHVVAHNKKDCHNSRGVSRVLGASNVTNAAANIIEIRRDLIDLAGDPRYDGFNTFNTSIIVHKTKSECDVKHVGLIFDPVSCQTTKDGEPIDFKGGKWDDS